MLHEAGGDEGEFWCIFACEANDIDGNAGEAADCDRVHEQSLAARRGLQNIVLDREMPWNS